MKNLSCPLKVVLTSSITDVCVVKPMYGYVWLHPDTFQYMIHENFQGDLLCPLRLYLTPSWMLVWFKPNYDCKTIWGGFISELLQITLKTTKGIFYVPWGLYLTPSQMLVWFKLNQTYWGGFISELLQKNCKGDLLCPLRLVPHS